MNFTHRDEEVNYFPSRFDPVRHSERYPIASTPLGGKREKAIIFKENNFAQPGARFRSFDAARQERFLGRLSEMLLDVRCTQEIRRIWGACALTIYKSRCPCSASVDFCVCSTDQPLTCRFTVEVERRRPRNYSVWRMSTC